MSNQEAIALLRNLEDSLDSYYELSEEGKTAFRMAIEALSSSEFPNSSDTISRAKAIEAVKRLSLGETDAMRLAMRIGDYLERLSPAQPEIIRCKDCKYASGNSRICLKLGHSPIGELDFCSYGERRTDEE